MSLADSQKFCADRVRRLDPDRYLSALFASDEFRPSLLALYAFNLEIATIGDNVSEMLIGRMRLQWWRDTLTRLQAGDDVGHGLCDSLAQVLKIDNFPISLLHRMIDGREFDLADRPPVSMGEVETYLESTAVGLMAAAWSVFRDPPDTSDSANDVARFAGLAMGLTGLIRMIPHNARRDRVFLPEDLMRRAGVTAEPILAGGIEAGHGEIISEIAAQALDYLERVRAAKPKRPALVAVLPVALAGDYLARLARANHDPFVPGLEPGRLYRQIRLTRAAWRGRV